MTGAQREASTSTYARAKLSDRCLLIHCSSHLHENKPTSASEHRNTTCVKLTKITEIVQITMFNARALEEHQILCFGQYRYLARFFFHANNKVYVDSTCELRGRANPLLLLFRPHQTKRRIEFHSSTQIYLRSPVVF